MSDQVRSSTSEPALGAMHPLREVWSIAWPTILTMTSYTIMQFVDALMVGQVGPVELTAQNNGGVWTFTPLAWVMGALTVVNTYTAQNLGAGRPESGSKYGWTAIWVSVLAWLVFMLPAAALVPHLFGAMKSHSPELVRMESGYARILLSGSVFMLCARGIGHYFFGMHRPKIITIATVAGNITNVILNYILIFGEAGLTAYADDGSVLFALPGVPGAPTLGVYGAAVATIIGTTVEFSIPLAVFLSPKWNRRYHTRAAWRPRWKTFREVVKLGWPCSIQWGNEIVCWSLFMSVIIGTFGEAHMTAGWIGLRYMHLAFMPTVGVATAVSSLVGKYIGAGRPNTGVARARLGLVIAVAYMTFCGGVFYLFRHQLVSLFVGGDTPPEQVREIIAIGGRIMVCAAVFQFFDAFGIVYSFALRGAGDTLWPSVATIVLSWSFIVGAGWLLAHLKPEWESLGPWIGAATFIIVFGITMAWRFESGKWRSIKLLDTPEEVAAKTGPVGPTPPASTPDASVRDRADATTEITRVG